MTAVRDRRVREGGRTLRPRRYVSAGTLRMLRLLGFRYSLSRDAYILRLVGHRFGPVLKPDHLRPREPDESPAVAPEPMAIDSWDQPVVTADQAAERDYTRRY